MWECFQLFDFDVRVTVFLFRQECSLHASSCMLGWIVWFGDPWLLTHAALQTYGLALQKAQSALTL